MFKLSLAALDQGIAGAVVSRLVYRQAKKPRVQAGKYHTIPYPPPHPNTTHMWQCFVEFAQYKQQNLEIPGEFICNQFCSSFYLKASLIAQNNIHKNYFCRSKFLISLLLSLLIMYHMNKHSSNIYWSVSLKLL